MQHDLDAAQTDTVDGSRRVAGATSLAPSSQPHGLEITITSITTWSLRVLEQYFQEAVSEIIEGRAKISNVGQQHSRYCFINPLVNSAGCSRLQTAWTGVRVDLPLHPLSPDRNPFRHELGDKTLIVPQPDLFFSDIAHGCNLRVSDTHR